MGTTGGGLWKTENMGISWRNISDGFFKTGTIGAIAVAESDPNVVYVGTGEHAIRGVMTHSGDGVYRSTDAGKTWKKIGLDSTRAHLAHRRPSEEPGHRPRRGAGRALRRLASSAASSSPPTAARRGRTSLFVDEKTGAVELSMDANNPRIMYAAMWEHGRLPWKVNSGGPGSGLYKSTDMGDTWTKMTEGLPDEDGQDGDRGQPLESGEGLRAHRKRLQRRRARALRLDERRQELEPGHERTAPRAARVVLHRALRRPEERQHDLRAERARAALR